LQLAIEYFTIIGQNEVGQNIVICQWQADQLFAKAEG